MVNLYSMNYIHAVKDKLLLMYLSQREFQKHNIVVKVEGQKEGGGSSPQSYLVLV